MKQLTRRIRQLEERAGYNDQVVYFIEVDDLTEAELKSYTTAKSATSLMGNADADKFMKSY